MKNISLTVLIFLFYTNSYATDSRNYSTPSRCKIPTYCEPRFCESATRAIQADALQIPSRREPSYYRDLIDNPDGDELSSIAARFRRKGPENFDIWFRKYLTIRSNSSTGYIFERVALNAFGILSNNIGNPRIYSDFDQQAKQYVTTRPDGIGFDCEGNLVVFEVKTTRPKTVLYFSKQLRAQARIKDVRANFSKHVVVMACNNCSDESDFPRPSRSFSKSKNTALRLIAGNGLVYRWVWKKYLRQLQKFGDGYWDPVQEKMSCKHGDAGRFKKACTRTYLEHNCDFPGVIRKKIDFDNFMLEADESCDC